MLDFHHFSFRQQYSLDVIFNEQVKIHTHVSLPLYLKICFFNNYILSHIIIIHGLFLIQCQT